MRTSLMFAALLTACSGSSGSDTSTPDGMNGTDGMDPADDATPPPDMGSDTVTFPAPFTPVRTVTVCPSGCDYPLLSAAIAAAQDYDLIEISAGDYVDCTTVPTAHVWIKGVGGMAHLHDKVCGLKAILITTGADVTVENVEFSGMEISSADGNNAAGIRVEGTHLAIRNCHFHDGQNGILGGFAGGDVVIDNSHFERLGVDGYEHGIYANHLSNVTVRNSVFELITEGHEVKSRAESTYLQCNRIMGGYDAAYSDSYDIDVPNGGETRIENNLIAQGPHQSNPTLVAYGAEGMTNPAKSLTVTGNIFINDYGSGTFVNVFGALTTGQMMNNTIVGNGTIVGGAGASSVFQSTNPTYADRSAAGISTQFPMPAACTAPVGLVPVQ